MADKKKRVRNHVIADLSVNHIAYKVLKAGFTIEVTQADYGYDGIIFTYDGSGEIENGHVFVQLKATDSIAYHKRKGGFSFSIKKKDTNLWSKEPFPVYLVLFDANREIAYWLYFQKYLKAKKITAATVTGKSLAVYIDEKNILDLTTPAAWRSDKEKVLNQLSGVIIHA